MPRAIAPLHVTLLLLSSCGARTGLEAPGAFGARSSTDAPSPVRTELDRRVSNLGTEFWPVTTPNTLLPVDGRFHFGLVLGNPSSDFVRVTIERGALREPRTVLLPPRSVVTETLPWVNALAQNTLRPDPLTSGICYGPVDLLSSSYITQSARVAGGAYRVRASSPIIAAQFNPLEYQVSTSACRSNSFTNDASLLLPTEGLGARYRVLTYRTAFSTVHDFVSVTATRDATEVQVTPTNPLRTGPGLAREIPQGERTRFTLAAGEVLLLASAGGVGTELTGTTIEASAPVAVHSGSDCTRVGGPDDSVVACDHLEEQLPPTNTWGRRALVLPFRDREPSVTPTRVRVLADRDETVVRLTRAEGGSPPPVTLAAGEFYQFDTSVATMVESSGPVLVAQYMWGQGRASVEQLEADPAMMLVPPLEQRRNTFAFAIPDSYTRNFVDVAIPQGTMVRVDGLDRSAEARRIARTEFAWLHLELEPGGHLVEADATEGATLGVYGVASYTSYAHAGGMNLTALER